MLRIGQDRKVVRIEQNHRLALRRLAALDRDFLRSSSRSRMASCNSSFIPSSSVNAPMVRRQSFDLAIRTLRNSSWSCATRDSRAFTRFSKVRLTMICRSTASLCRIVAHGRRAVNAANRPREGGRACAPSILGRLIRRSPCGKLPRWREIKFSVRPRRTCLHDHGMNDCHLSAGAPFQKSESWCFAPRPVCHCQRSLRRRRTQVSIHRGNCRCRWRQ